MTTPKAIDDLERLFIERTCERLIIAYSHFIDFGEAARVAELFTADGVWQLDEAAMRGRDEIANGFGRRQANADRRSRHVCTNLMVDVVSPTEATGLCYFSLYRADGVEGPIAPLDGPAVVGEYRDNFALTDEGWRIAHRKTSAGFVRSEKQ